MRSLPMRLLGYAATSFTWVLVLAVTFPLL